MLISFSIKVVIGKFYFVVKIWLVTIVSRLTKCDRSLPKSLRGNCGLVDLLHPVLDLSLLLLLCRAICGGHRMVCYRCCSVVPFGRRWWARNFMVIVEGGAGTSSDFVG
jgi:hypothetical protein